MERLTETETGVKAEQGAEERRKTPAGSLYETFFSPDGPRGIRARWLLNCLLPAAGIVSAAAALASVFAVFAAGNRAVYVIVFAWAVAVAVILALWLVCDRFIAGVAGQLRALREQTRRMTERSYGIKTGKLWDDELGDLTDSVNMLDDEIARDRAVQSEFISSVSHELRTPLTAVMGWAEALTFDKAIQGDSRRGLGIIEKEAGRLTKMVSELLDFTRIQDGRFNLNLEEVDLAAEVEDAVFTYRNLMDQDGIELRYDCDEAAIPMIEGDPERLKQVLLNVLDNAVKYGRDGGTIEVSLTAEKEGGVAIRVRDHGPGIPEDELPHVKERFYKGSSKERGSGIGLAVCEEIVTRHGGKLLIENAKDENSGGVLVTVRLPVRQSSVEKRNA